MAECSSAGDQFAALRANGLDAERAESDTLNKQMADAYEVQATELEAAKAAILQIQTDTGHAFAERVRLDGVLHDVCSKLTAAKMAVELFIARAIEIERQTSELCTEFGLAHHGPGNAPAEFSDICWHHARKF